MPKLNTSMLNTAVVDYSDSVETPIATSTVESSVATIDINDADTQEFLAESSDDELAGEDTSVDGVPFETEEVQECPRPLTLVRTLVSEDYRLMNDDEVLQVKDLMLFCHVSQTGEQHAGFQPHPFGMFADFTVANGKEKFASRTNGGLCEFYRWKNDLIEQLEESEPVATAPETTEPAKPVEATEPTETPEPEWDAAAERKKDESAFIRELKELSVEVSTKEAELEALKEQIKVAKAEHNLAVAKLQSFAAAGVKYRSKPTKPAKPTPKPADTKGEPAKTEPAKAESTDAPKPATDAPTATVDAPKEEIGKESWRATKTESILEGVERLGKTKRAKLLEHFPTFGHLMDARIEASKEFVPFAKKLPDGIGEGIATELINRMDAVIVPGM